MPVDKDKKLSLISKFREKMNYLHNLLKEIQKDGWKEVETLSTRDKSKSRSGVESKVDELQRDQVRKVENAYNEVLFFFLHSFSSKEASSTTRKSPPYLAYQTISNPLTWLTGHGTTKTKATSKPNVAVKVSVATETSFYLFFLL